MTTVTMRFEQKELDDIALVRALVSREFKVSRHRLMKRALREGLKVIKQENELRY